MTGRDITGTYSSGITLTSAGDNPVTMAGTAVISSPTGPGIQASAGIYWTIDTSGHIAATGAVAGDNGVALAGGGAVTNEVGGVIAGFDVGVSITGTGTLVNHGSITTSDTTGPGYSYGGGVLTPLTGGVILGGGGVSNASGGVITGYSEGVAIGSAGTVTNAGSIVSGLHGFGIALPAGGTVTNASTGNITSGRYAIISLGANAATVTNQGSIGSGYIAIDMFHGSTISNLAGTISGATDGVVTGGVSTLINQAVIIGTTTEAVGLFGGGSVTNEASGTLIGGIYGISAGNVLATLTNLGTISGTTKAGVGIFAGGSVINSGTGGITGGKYGVLAANTAASVTNMATITALTVAGVGMLAGGSVANAAGAEILGGRFGVAATGSTTTLTNQGTVTGSVFGAAFYAGGYVSSGSTGTITANYFGVRMTGASGSVNNLGSIASFATFTGASGFDAAGVDLDAGGVVTNGTSGKIRATWKGVEIGDQTASVGGTLINQGYVFASNPAGNTGAAVWIHGPAVVTNTASGTITGGPFGIVTYFQTTVVNLGSIGGTEYAVDPTVPGYANLVAAAPGAVFSGLVSGGNTLGSTITSVLELMTGASVGTISSFDSNYIGFGEVQIDPGARWMLGGPFAPSQTLDFSGTHSSLDLVNPTQMGGTIHGFLATDTIDLGGITDVNGVTLGINNVLTIHESAGPGLTLAFDPAQNFNSKPFSYQAVTGGTDLTVACFAAGTRIATEHGAIPVEAVRPGMRVRALFGGVSPVRWVGQRRIDCRRHPNPRDVWPIRVQAGAFGPAQPAADLYLSPDHALYVEAVLIPVRHLVNGTTIRQEPVDAVTYYHVELDQHDVLLAEGLPAESYLNAGDRANFTNSGDAVRLFPAFGTQRLDLWTAWESQGCAPLVVCGAELDSARALVAARATALADAAMKAA